MLHKNHKALNAHVWVTLLKNKQKFLYLMHFICFLGLPLEDIHNPPNKCLNLEETPNESIDLEVYGSISTSIHSPWKLDHLVWREKTKKNCHQQGCRPKKKCLCKGNLINYCLGLVVEVRQRRLREDFGNKSISNNFVHPSSSTMQRILWENKRLWKKHLDWVPQPILSKVYIYIILCNKSLFPLGG